MTPNTFQGVTVGGRSTGYSTSAATLEASSRATPTSSSACPSRPGGEDSNHGVYLAGAG